MKASELIDEHGDRDVIYSDYNSLYGSYDYVAVDEVFDVYIENKMKFYIE